MAAMFLSRLSMPLKVGDRQFTVTVLDDDATLWVPVHATFGLLPGGTVIPSATFFDATKGGAPLHVPFSCLAKAIRLERAGEGVAAITLDMFRDLAATGGEAMARAVEAWALDRLAPEVDWLRAQRRSHVTTH